MTVLELLVSLMLAGVLLGVSTIGVQKITRSLALKRSAMRIASFIERCSILAIRKGKEININVFSERLQRDKESLFFDKHVNLISVRPSDRLSFYPNGVASPAQIVIGSAQKTCTLTVSIRGRVLYRC